MHRLLDEIDRAQLSQDVLRDLGAELRKIGDTVATRADRIDGEAPPAVVDA